MRKSFLEKGKDTPIERFYGVGEKRAEAFHKIGVFTAADAVYRFPPRLRAEGQRENDGERAGRRGMLPDPDRCGRSEERGDPQGHDADEIHGL